MKKYIVAALHGDELFGLKVIANLLPRYSHDVVFRVGHPEAIAKHLRYIEQDLNRSFDSNNGSIEAIIAEDIKHEITELSPELIIDIHTSVSDVDKVAIVAKKSPLIEYVAVALGMDAIVIMPRHLSTTALIGCFPDTTLSLEFGKNYGSDKHAAEIADRIESLDYNIIKSRTSLPVFKVYSEINKNFAGLESIKNLIYNKALDGYPFLAGADTYESFGGFLAKKIN